LREWRREGDVAVGSGWAMGYMAVSRDTLLLLVEMYEESVSQWNLRSTVENIVVEHTMVEDIVVEYAVL
jgi:hypothetical protein